MMVLSLAPRLATQISLAQAHATLGWFLGSASSTEVIEQTVLGLGRRTGDWLERALAPEGDGEVTIILVDSKGAPRVTRLDAPIRRAG